MTEERQTARQDIFVTRLAEELSCSKDEARRVLGGFEGTLISLLKDYDRVSLVGFMDIERRNYKPRRLLDITSREMITIEGRQRIKITPKGDLKCVEPADCVKTR